MVASVDSAESGPSEGTLDPAEIDFGGPVDFEARQARPCTDDALWPRDVQRRRRRARRAAPVQVHQSVRGCFYRVAELIDVA